MRTRRAVSFVVVTTIVAVAVVCAAGCQQKPPACEPLRQRIEKVKRDAGGVYAVKAVKTADDLVSAAALSADEQDKRIAFMRSYDAKACADAVVAAHERDALVLL